MDVLRTLWPEETEHDRAERVRAMQVAWPLILAAGAVNAALAPSWAAGAIWACWGLAQLALASGARRGGVRRAQVLGTAANVLPSFVVAGLAAVHGGDLRLVGLVALATIPMVDSLFSVPDLGGPLLAGAAALALGTPTALQHLGGLGRGTVGWALAVVGVTAVAMAQSHARRLRREAEVRAERERGEALEALAESRLARVDAEALKSLGVLADEVAHEVNSPLAAVKASLEFALYSLPDHGAEVEEALGDGLSGVDRIRAIVSRLQALHHGWAARRYVRPLRGAALDAAEIARARVARRAEVHVEVPAEVSALAPWPLVVEMLATLILQAAHGAREACPSARIEVLGGVTGDRLAFEVRTSCPPSAVATTAPGHGLTMCAEYARRIGGSLLIEPARPAGTRLALELPLHPEPLVVPLSAPQEEPVRPHLRIVKR